MYVTTITNPMGFYSLGVVVTWHVRNAPYVTKIRDPKQLFTSTYFLFTITNQRKSNKPYIYSITKHPNEQEDVSEKSDD